MRAIRTSPPPAARRARHEPLPAVRRPEGPHGRRRGGRPGGRAQDRLAARGGRPGHRQRPRMPSPGAGARPGRRDRAAPGGIRPSPAGRGLAGRRGHQRPRAEPAGRGRRRGPPPVLQRRGRSGAVQRPGAGHRGPGAAHHRHLLGRRRARDRPAPARTHRIAVRPGPGRPGRAGAAQAAGHPRISTLGCGMFSSGAPCGAAPPTRRNPCWTRRWRPPIRPRRAGCCWSAPAPATRAC